MDISIMGWKTIIIGSECIVSLTLDRMKIKIGEEFQNIALCDIDTVIFSHQRVTITIPIISKLIENNINVIVCNEKNDPIGVFLGFHTHCLSYKQLNLQLNWSVIRKKQLWKTIVKHKIISEMEVLGLLQYDPEVIHTLRVYADSIYNNDQTNREAVAARYYFASLFGESFTRDEESVVNYALNYGYKILASYISKCIVSRGLITQLGIHHIGEANAFNLTYDFIEPFRAIIDIWVKETVKESFNPCLKQELIGILNYKVSINHQWIRLVDGIEDIIDSYIGFLNHKRDDVLRIDLSKGLQECE